MREAAEACPSELAAARAAAPGGPEGARGSADSHGTNVRFWVNSATLLENRFVGFKTHLNPGQTKSVYVMPRSYPILIVARPPNLFFFRETAPRRSATAPSLVSANGAAPATPPLAERTPARARPRPGVPRVSARPRRCPRPSWSVPRGPRRAAGRGKKLALRRRDRQTRFPPRTQVANGSRCPICPTYYRQPGSPRCTVHLPHLPLGGRVRGPAATRGHGVSRKKKKLAVL